MAVKKRAVKPFWENTYRNDDVSTFSKGPTKDIEEYWTIFPLNGTVLDAGCGEGRNSVFLAEKNFTVDAFDISKAGIEKAKRIADARGVKVNFMRRDLTKFIFIKNFDIILCHGVLHLCEKIDRDIFKGY